MWKYQIRDHVCDIILQIISKCAFLFMGLKFINLSHNLAYGTVGW